jgi:hypothetical protein
MVLFLCLEEALYLLRLVASASNFMQAANTLLPLLLAAMEACAFLHGAGENMDSWATALLTTAVLVACSI